MGGGFQIIHPSSRVYGFDINIKEEQFNINMKISIIIYESVTAIKRKTC